MTMPYILVAPNGARRGKADHPALPITIAEIVNAARQCCDAGANGIHAHVRDQDGAHVLDAGLYRELIDELAVQVPDMDVQITTEAVGIYSPVQQMDVVAKVRPKMVSIALSELDTHENKAELSRFYHGLDADGVEVQHIIYDPAEMHRFEQMVDQSIIPAVKHSFLFVLGRYTVGQLSNPQHFDPFYNAFQRSPFAQTGKFMTCAFGARETYCLLHAADKGSDCRIGFENNLLMENGEPAANNAQRVAELVTKLAQDPEAHVS